MAARHGQADGLDANAGERVLVEAALREAPPGGPVSAVRLREAFPGYEVVRELHRGGQGVVYLGIQTGTRRKVAIKVLHEGPFVGATGRARFDREVQVLGQLDHANIVKIHESGATDAGALFYVMDYVPGRALDDYVTGSER